MIITFETFIFDEDVLLTEVTAVRYIKLYHWYQPTVQYLFCFTVCFSLCVLLIFCKSDNLEVISVPLLKK